MKKTFFAGLFVTSIIGIQMVEAARVKCPDAASIAPPTIVPAIVNGKHRMVHKYIGYATDATGAKKYIFTNMEDKATDPVRHPQGPAEAMAGPLQLSCLYHDLTLNSEDAGAIKDCYGVPGTDYFNCQ